MSWRTSFLLTTTYRKGHQLKSCVWISLCSRKVWRKSCLMTWLMERSVGRLNLWAPSIHTSSGLYSKVSFGPHVCLSEAILNPVLHWHTDYFAWAELQLELMLHPEHSHCLLTCFKRKLGFSFSLSFVCFTSNFPLRGCNSFSTAASAGFLLPAFADSVRWYGHWLLCALTVYD